MAIQITEGGIVALDAHTDALLYAYTASHNAWIDATWAATMPDAQYAADHITAEEMARQILSEFLHQWARERRNAAKFRR